MSKRVITTCTLLLLLGVAGGLDSAMAFSRGQIHINLMVLLLPVSLALFTAMPGARLAATIAFSILYLFLALVLLAPLIGGSSTQFHVLPVGAPLSVSFAVVFVVVSMIGSLLALLHWMLFSPPFEEHLNL